MIEDDKRNKKTDGPEPGRPSGNDDTNKTPSSDIDLSKESMPNNVDRAEEQSKQAAPDGIFEQSPSEDRQETSPRAESGFFADYHNVRDGVAEVREVDGLKPEHAQQWEQMSKSERLESLQEAEDRMARVQGRPAERVHGESMGEGSYGKYVDSGPQRGIYVNTDKLDDRAESVNTVVHEGRHAYQSQAVEQPGFHPERPGIAGHDDNREWKANDADYKTVQKDGPDAYMTQSNEHDAGGFGVAVTKGVYPEYEPSPDRIDQYNAETAQNKYGNLKTSSESQKVTSSDPPRFGQRETKQTPQRAAKPSESKQRGAETSPASRSREFRVNKSKSTASETTSPRAKTTKAEKPPAKTEKPHAATKSQGQSAQRGAQTPRPQQPTRRAASQEPASPPAGDGAKPVNKPAGKAAPKSKPASKKSDAATSGSSSAAERRRALKQRIRQRAAAKGPAKSNTARPKPPGGKPK